MQYVTPENQTYSVKEEENQLVYTLIPIEMLTVSGLVKMPIVMHYRELLSPSPKS